MFKVTVNVSEDDLFSFLEQVGTAEVEHIPGTGRARQADQVPFTPAAAAPAEAPPPAAAPKPRGRRPNPPPDAPAEPPAQNSQVTDVKDLLGGTPDRAELLTKFTALVDSDYDKALEALTSFKVQRFSDIPDDQLGAFAAAIS